MRTPLAAITLLSVALAACGGAAEEGGANHIAEGTVTVRPAAGAWTPAAAGPVAFATGTAIEASADGATLDASLGGKARATVRLGPGARISRRAANALVLEIGTIAVSTIGIEDRILLYHAETYAEVGRVIPGNAEFTATVVGDQIAVVVKSGGVQLNTTGATPMELHYTTVGAKEQGLAATGTKPAKLHVDDAPDGPYLTPRISLAIEDGSAGSPLRLTVTIEPGQSGAFHGLLVPDGEALVVQASGPSGERAIALRASHVGAPLAPWFLSLARKPFRVSFDVADHGLTAGTWTLHVRYLSYREHADGPEWIGVVESPPVSVTLSD